MSRPDWQQTFKGGVFETLDPDPASIDIEDVAHALSNLCRYAGHTKGFYSVANHSVYVARLCPERYRLEGLLHDAAEAFVVDLPRPVKRQLPAYAEIEERVAKAVAVRFGLTYPWPESVIKADNQMLATEARMLMAWPPPRPWNLPESAVPGYDELLLNPWSPRRAERKFLEAFYLLRRS